MSFAPPKSQTRSYGPCCLLNHPHVPGKRLSRLSFITSSSTSQLPNPLLLLLFTLVALLSHDTPSAQTAIQDMVPEMSSRKYPSGSRSSHWYGDYTWDLPSASTVDGCGRRLSDLSMVSPTAPSRSVCRADPGSYWGILGSPGMAETHQASFENQSREPVLSNHPPSISGGNQASEEPELISFPSGPSQKLDSGTFSGLGDNSGKDDEAGYTTSTHVSPSSSSP